MSLTFTAPESRTAPGSVRRRSPWWRLFWSAVVVLVLASATFASGHTHAGGYDDARKCVICQVVTQPAPPHPASVEPTWQVDLVLLPLASHGSAASESEAAFHTRPRAPPV